jgi:hypothetical protein
MVRFSDPFRGETCMQVTVHKKMEAGELEANLHVSPISH